MSIWKRTSAAALFFAGLIAIPSIANAAYASTSVNERAGPSTAYAIITTVPAGAYVEVHRCPTSWCQVTYAGLTGWVSGSYIGHGAAYRYQPSVVVQPSISLEFRFGDRDHGRHYIHHDRRTVRHIDRNDRRYVRDLERHKPPKYIARDGKFKAPERFAERPNRSCHIPGRCQGPG